MRVRTLKMSAWTKFRITSRPTSATGRTTSVRAVIAEGHLAAVDVAEESHREGQRLDELEHQLDEADEHGDDARADPILELVEREELAQVPADAEALEALVFEEDEARRGQGRS